MTTGLFGYFRTMFESLITLLQHVSVYPQINYLYFVIVRLLPYLFPVCIISVQMMLLSDTMMNIIPNHLPPKYHTNFGVMRKGNSSTRRVKFLGIPTASISLELIVNHWSSHGHLEKTGPQLIAKALAKSLCATT